MNTIKISRILQGTADYDSDNIKDIEQRKKQIKYLRSKYNEKKKP